MVYNGGHRFTEHKYAIIFHIGQILLEIFDVQYLTNCMLLKETKKKKTEALELL